MRFQAFLNRLDKLSQAMLSKRLLQALFRHRVLAGAEHRHVLLRDLGTVVDIGANRGQFALAARRWAPKARVISFEPLPNPASVFRSVFAGDLVIRLHVAAIGEKAEKTLIHLSARDDSSSLLEIGNAQSSFFPGTHEVGTLEVDVGPLDQFVSKEDIARPAMLKLDVQGFEMQALAGCRSLIGYFDYVYCECSFVELYKGQKLAGEVISYLGGLGFGLSGIYNPSYDRVGNCIQADLLFTQMGK